MFTSAPAKKTQNYNNQGGYHQGGYNRYYKNNNYGYNRNFYQRRREDEEIVTEFPPETPGKRIPLGGDNVLDIEAVDKFYTTVMDEIDKQEKIKELIAAGKDPAEIEKITEDKEKLTAEMISAGLTEKNQSSSIEKITQEMQRPLDFIEKERNAHCRLYQHNDTQYVIDYIDFLYAKDLVETDQDKCVVEKSDLIKNIYTTEITINDLFISNQADNKRESKLGACEKMRELLDEEYGNLVDFKMLLDGAEALKTRPKRNPKNKRRIKKRVMPEEMSSMGVDLSKKQRKELTNLGHLDQNVIKSGIHENSSKIPGTSVQCEYMPISNASMPMAEMRQRQILEERRQMAINKHANQNDVL